MKSKTSAEKAIPDATLFSSCQREKINFLEFEKELS